MILDLSLPPWLAERTRWLQQGGDTASRSSGVSFTKATSAHIPGSFVLYWMHNAIRGHENPALDVAIHAANRWQIPLLVYQGLGEDYAYASDRHHSFILQAARDVQRELEGRGIRYVFHLQRRGERGPHLKTLAKLATLLVTEDIPVDPLVGWLERLRSSCDTPIACVDASCVVPMSLVIKPVTRAFEFRKQISSYLRQRIDRPWQEMEVHCPMYMGALPFVPLDLQDCDLAEVIGMCDIDHTIAPIADTPGGSRAGYARWEHFKKNALSQYASQRTDPTKPAAGSRLSSYLNYGMISPLRIAREAHAHRAEKFLDELIVWRELAYHYCFHRQDNLHSFATLPEWAQATLREHSGDPRPSQQSWESLARARSGDPLWDACQRSLLKHGELHNNVRMTWGKSFLQWADSPERALGLAVDLNHRYALDGRSPASYGGLLWCFGQFDRPFYPAQPIYGTVRQRSLAEHSARLDMQKFEQIVDRPISGLPARVAIVGAGMGGLSAARALHDHGVDVTLFEKSRGVGGRVATRRAATGVFFDHGAQYFTVRDNRFARRVCSWIDLGLVTPWSGKIVVLNHGKVGVEKREPIRYVAVPAMNSIARHLSADLPITRETTIRRAERRAGATAADQSAADKNAETESWFLEDAEGHSWGPFDYLILNCPPPQAAAILASSCDFKDSLAAIAMDPCWAVLVELEQPLPCPFDAAFIHDSPLNWIARDSSKPLRPNGEAWIMHASPQWSREHLEEDPDEVLTELLDAFSEATGEMIVDPVNMAAHRWRYARPQQPLDVPCLWDATMQVAACGDWCDGPRIEGAVLSGEAAAGAVLRHLTIDRKSPRT